MSKHLTSERVLELLREAVEANPDKKNPADGGFCVYQVDEPEPGENPRCIVGEVLYRAGLTIPEPGAGSFAHVYRSHLRYRNRIDEDAAEILITAQSVFDTGSPWESAYDEFIRESEEYLSV